MNVVLRIGIKGDAVGLRSNGGDHVGRSDGPNGPLNLVRPWRIQRLRFRDVLRLGDHDWMRWDKNPTVRIAARAWKTRTAPRISPANQEN